MFTNFVDIIYFQIFTNYKFSIQLLPILYQYSIDTAIFSITPCLTTWKIIGFVAFGIFDIFIEYFLFWRFFNKNNIVPSDYVRTFWISPWNSKFTSFKNKWTKNEAVQNSPKIANSYHFFHDKWRVVINSYRIQNWVENQTKNGI